MKRPKHASGQEKRTEKEWEMQQVREWKSRLIPLETRTSEMRKLVQITKKDGDYMPVVKELLLQMPSLIEELVFLQSRRLVNPRR